MARLQVAVVAIALFGLLAVATAESQASRELQGWDWPNVRVTTPVGKVNVRPYAWNVQNLVGANWIMPQWWVSGFPEATGKSGNRRLLGWDWPNVRVTTPIGKINARPYAWNVQNIVGANWIMPQWWVSGFPEATGKGN